MQMPSHENDPNGPEVATDAHEADGPFHAWNPGLNSTIPPHLQPLVSLFRAENAYTGFDEATEASNLCGLPITRMVDLRAERMIGHELLVRVTTDLTVPDGPDYEYLGLSLRAMVRRIHDNHIDPVLPELDAGYERFRCDTLARMEEILSTTKAQPDQDSGGFLSRMFKRQPARKKSLEDTEREDMAKLTLWRNKADVSGHNNDEKREAAIHAAIAEVAASMISHRGRIITDHGLMARLALRLFCQDYGPGEIRRMIEPVLNTAINREGFRRLPYQRKRIVMNVKGASAAGKSTVRPKQRELAEKLGVAWEDFALISPDYWRKYLLDYDSLGADYKYAAMLTGQELSIIDHKLDRYMEQKAERQEMPHLLIDRFRFDSFMVDSSGDYHSTLLTRFGDMVFLFFVITAPAETVERAWKRGLTTQRYKAVDDLLYHNREAFTGIPELFFSWTAISDKTIHYEFLDNDVALGSPPRTIAFGEGGQMVILDPVALANIDRFRSVNLDARTPDAVLIEGEGPDYSFLSQCIAAMPGIELANFDTSRIYGRISKGKWVSSCFSHCPDSVKQNPPLLKALGWSEGVDEQDEGSVDAAAARLYTLGQWGEKG